MQSLTIENLVNAFKKVRPIVAAVTVFAYVNAFILPITSASANPNKDGEEQEVRKTNPRARQPKQEPFKITPITPGQVNFTNKIKTLFRYVAEVKSTEIPKQKKIAKCNPRLNSEPTTEQKQRFIRHVIDYAVKESQSDVDTLRADLKAEKLNKHTLRFVQYLRKELKDQLGTTFAPSQQSEVRRALKYLKDFTAQEQDNTQAEIAFIKDNLSEARETHAYVKEAFDALEDKAPLWKAMDQLRKVLPKVEEKLPERVLNAIQKHSLTSVCKEYASSENGITAFLASIVDKVTSPTAAKIAIGLAVVNAPAVAAAFGVTAPLRHEVMSKGQFEESESENSGPTLCQLIESGQLGAPPHWEELCKQNSNEHSFNKRAMTITNRNTPFLYNQGVPTLITPPLSFVGATGDIVGNSGFGVPAWMATATFGPTPPGVTLTYVAPPAGTYVYHGYYTTGNHTLVEQYDATMQFVPIDASIRNWTSSMVIGFSDGVTFVSGNRLATPNFNYYLPPTNPPCSLPSTSQLTNGGTVILSDSNCNINNINEFGPDQTIIQFSNVRNGFFNLASAPSIPANCTKSQMQAGQCQFTHAGNNLQPSAEFQVCDPQVCATTRSTMTMPFTATPPTDNTFNLIGAVIGGVGAFLAIVGIGAGIWYNCYYKKKSAVTSRENAPQAQYIRRKLNLDVENFNEGHGEQFKNFVIILEGKLTQMFGERYTNQKESFTDTYLISNNAITYNVPYSQNPRKWNHWVPKWKLNLTALAIQDENFETSTTTIANKAATDWNVNNTNDQIELLKTAPDYQQANLAVYGVTQYDVK